MKTIYYSIKGDEFILYNYNNQKPFASFLPAIAGKWGAPIWCFYVNRAQAISCFGSKDKNGAILEFIAANKAYRLTPLQGFRTFLKINKNFYEPFQNPKNLPFHQKIFQSMNINSHSLKISEVNLQYNLEFSVEYFNLPEEEIPALIRILSIKNISKSKVKLEVIDGLPIIIPYGTNDFLLKNMSRLADGWFSGVQFICKEGIPIYKLQVEPEDRPEVIPIQYANFYYGFLFQNNKITLPEFIVDPDNIFDENTDFRIPLNFIYSEKINKKSTANNKTPSGFGYFKSVLNSNEQINYISIIGASFYISELAEFTKKFKDINYIENKRERNKIIHNEIKENILTVSNISEFDNYCGQTFLDNTLRGGYPIKLGEGEYKKIYYLYSRIHGDMEREYNNFVILPEFFSQGNGSYRDVNQNRRSDVFFRPFIEDEEIIYFMNLIQLDGFNPLGLIGFKFEIIQIENFLNLFSEKERKLIFSFIEKPFTLGELFIFLKNNKIEITIEREEFINLIMKYSKKIEIALPSKGYWSDHWHYNIDLIENFLAIYPERLNEILIQKRVFKYYDTPFFVKPRKEKYVLFNGIPHQLNSVEKNDEKEKMINERERDKYWVRTNYGKGEIYNTILLEKLLSLVANKFASLDPEGIGIEMESERPNWCDALNGLPGVFGSSICETIELKRLIVFILNSFEKLNLNEDFEIFIAEEVVDYLYGLKDILIKYKDDKFKFWDESHNLKEVYREKTFWGISGNLKSIKLNEIKEILNLFSNFLDNSIEKAFDKKKKFIYSYFKNEVVEYEKLDNDRIKPLKFKSIPLPFFLEGAVHYLRVYKDKAKNLHKSLLKTGVYDRKLKMFKLNESLKNEDFKIGRIKVFTSGWLENESIWLHMEYKYLLELLKSGLVDEFYKISKSALIPFMDPKVYGRSIFENVSFIVSSAHPDKNIWGQGFVSRLSGSTAEFLSIWIEITSGSNPFFIKDNQLYLKFSPKIPNFMFTKEEKLIKKTDGEEILIPKNSFGFNFLGKIFVIYNNPKRKDTYGKKCCNICSYKIFYNDNRIEEIEGEILPPPYSEDIRNYKVKKIEVLLK